MDTDNAFKIISLLASGLDPFTGEVFPSNSTLQHPDVVRALYIAAMALQNVAGKSTNKSVQRNPNLPRNAGTSWSEAEDHRLAQAFDAGKTEKELAALHQRTLGAIRSRLIKLGKLETQDTRVNPHVRE